MGGGEKLLSRCHLKIKALDLIWGQIMGVFQILRESVFVH